MQCLGMGLIQLSAPPPPPLHLPPASRSHCPRSGGWAESSAMHSRRASERRRQGRPSRSIKRRDLPLNTVILTPIFSHKFTPCRSRCRSCSTLWVRSAPPSCTLGCAGGQQRCPAAWLSDCLRTCIHTCVCSCSHPAGARAAGRQRPRRAQEPSQEHQLVQELWGDIRSSCPGAMDGTHQ